MLTERIQQLEEMLSRLVEVTDAINQRVTDGNKEYPWITGYPSIKIQAIIYRIYAWISCYSFPRRI